MNRAEQIVSVAHRLMLERGYSAFSYADIADVIGIQKASIHYHFPSKDNLVQKVVQHYRGGVRSNLSQLDSLTDDPRKKLEHYLNYWNACLQDKAIDICLCAQLASEIPILPEEVRGEVQAHFQELTGWIANLLREASEAKQYERSGRSFEEDAAMILAAVHGGMLAARTFNDGTQFQAISSQILDQLNAARSGKEK
ncbi:TetR/AcrR family transcriptional regulator [Paenibacillus beijingensis]|nr:TetR/AcrR family transcriptional regulator [Paenibacillus beijingensis]